MLRRSRRLLTAAVGALVASTTWSLGLPSVASAAAGTSDHVVAPQAVAQGVASPEMVAAMRRDLGLTTEQVQVRLTAESRATATEELATAALGAAFAGAWFDNRAGRLVVATTDAAVLSRLRALGADGVVVARSLAELTATQERIDRLSGTAAPSAVTSWYVDVVTNSVVLVVDRGRMGPAAERFVAAARRSADVRVVDRAEAPRPAYNVVGGNAYYIGNSRCSIGFSARTSGGGKRFLTAGHCTAGGGAVYGANRVRMGSASGSTFGPAGDYGKVSVTSDSWRLRPWVNLYDGRALVVRNANPASVGQSVCRSGSTSGWRCGEIKAKNVTVNYPGRTVGGLVRSSACAAPGDSGGPFVHADRAQGLTSGITSQCGSGGQTDSFYQPVREALNAYNLNLVTG